MTEEREQREHKPKFQSLVDKLQTAGIVIGLILGLRQPPAPGSEEEKRVPGWIMSNLDFLTHEDEILHAVARASHPDPRLKNIELSFVERVERDGYAPNKYRALIAGMWQKFMDQVRQPAPENKSAGHLAFQSVILGNPCLSFFDELIVVVDAGGTPEEIYQQQKRAARGSNLLVKKSILQKIREHPWFSLTIFASGIVASPFIFYWILRAIL